MATSIQFVTTKGNQNDGKYSNAEVDKLLDEARTIYDVAERKKRYDAAQKSSSRTNCRSSISTTRPSSSRCVPTSSGFVINPGRT